MGAPTFTWDRARFHFRLGGSPSHVAMGAQISLASVEFRAIGQRHRSCFAQREVTGLMRGMASKATYGGWVVHHLLGIDFPDFRLFDEAFAGMAGLAVVAISV
jgi:hypothetical protein